MPDVKIICKGSEAHPLDARTLRWRKRWCLIAMLVFAVVIGALEQIFAADEEMDKLLTGVTAVIGIVLIVLWCQYDSQERNFRIKKSLLLLIILLAIIGVPAYLLKTRGMRGILSILLALMFSGMCVLVELLAIEIVYRIS